jgi:hypothetical protein
MLTYILVWIISLGSVGLYLIAYLFPEIHRKNDWIGGGVGLFYGLILAANAQTMPAGLLVGHFASVGLILWLGQQMLSQRRLLVTENAPRPEPGSMRDRLRTLVIQGWKLIEPLMTLMSNAISKALEKPQEAKISEISVEAPGAEAEQFSFVDQLTQPLSNLSGNLTGLFKSSRNNQEAASTVTIQATAAPDDAADPAVSEPEAIDTVTLVDESAPTLEISAQPESQSTPDQTTANVTTASQPSPEALPQVPEPAQEAAYPYPEGVIKGGDLQPEEKPKEWNDPDPLA